MPTPAELQKFIDSAENFDPSAVRDEYTTNQPMWQLYLDLMELDQVKLMAMLDKHKSDESDNRTTYRRQLVAVVNLIPTVINMIRDYLFGEEPRIDVQNDEALRAFIDDCDGAGTKFVDLLKNRVVPLALGLGMVDLLVQNPYAEETLLTEADAQSEKLRPVAIPITPLQRINWSTNSNGVYNWICFEDTVSEDDNPFRRGVKPTSAHVTISAATPKLLATKEGKSQGYWIRSWKEEEEGDGGSQGESEWQHTAGHVPTARVPVATLYYQQSLDHKRPHFGISKIAVMAVLTKLIVQVLSWSVEDMKANLAILHLQNKSGKAPKAKDEDGNAAVAELDVFSIIWTSYDAKMAPSWVQGSVDHIRMKMDFVKYLVQEILRCAHLLGASAEAEQVTSGVQGVVMRNELFQELSGLAVALDSFAYETLALAKSWDTNEDWDRKRLVDELKVTVEFNKGPYATAPLDQVIKDANAVISLFGTYSPTMTEAQLKNVARASMYAEDPDLEKVMEEVEEHTGAMIDQQRDAQKAANDALINADGTESQPPTEEMEQ